VVPGGGSQWSRSVLDWVQVRHSVTTGDARLGPQVS
jgi:hypothetical protein